MRPRMALRDLADEALAGVLARPGRAVLTVLGTVLGIAALVATLGVSRTAGSQIVGRFDELAATEVQAQPKGSGLGGGRTVANVIPWDAEQRMRRLNGVRAAGTITDVDVQGALVRSVPVVDPRSQTAFALSVKAGSPGLFEAVRGRIGRGRAFDEGHSSRRDRVAVLGRGAAERLGIDRVGQQPAIYIGEQLYVVVGILDDVARRPELLNAVIIPDGTAAADFDLAGPGAVQIETVVGGAKLIAAQAPVALNPNQPDSIEISRAPEPRRAKSAVEGDVNSLFLILGGVSLLVGAIGIANVTLVSVLERVGEIGLRRALGAARRHVAAQFLAESTVMGLVGGVVGASAGTLVVVGVAAARTWTPVMDARLVLLAPLLGAVVGLLAGLYPALRAAALEPVEALRAGT